MQIEVRDHRLRYDIPARPRDGHTQRSPWMLVPPCVARIAHLTDGFSEPDLTDAIARQIELRKSLWRQPPI